MIGEFKFFYLGTFFLICQKHRYITMITEKGKPIDNTYGAIAG